LIADKQLRPAINTDWPAILTLNEQSVEYLSPMDEPRLAQLASAAYYFRVVEIDGTIAGFLLGFRKGASYDSPNFLWFNSRFDDFFYVDRVVVAPEFRGQKLADRLYDDFESAAHAAGVTRITCEVNIEPPNPASLRFHERRGFREIGRQPYGDRKIVAMFARELV
jgi:predicted GNAT superfamily acetyltransferase